MSGFGQWLAAFEGEGSAIGDLARDAAADPLWPDGPDEIDVFREHLEELGVMEAALETLGRAWEQYEVWS
ncbi:YozE family protein [Streptomyces sp. NBC_01244]|uniref:YozE family protein n=1 Tax=Streptomyces sp. NBC_01244 TaxID=2903797 RepID=UPI002E0D56CC|nr:sterile alpha motif-like domain-containing protein [Streptomyces sp. NBC_01244]